MCVYIYGIYVYIYVYNTRLYYYYYDVGGALSKTDAPQQIAVRAG